MKTKKCPNCKEIKLYSDFHKNLRNKSGIQNSCKKCLAERRKTDKYQQTETKRLGKHKENGVSKKWQIDYKERLQTIYEIEKNRAAEELIANGYKKVIFHKLMYINNNGDIIKLPFFLDFQKNKLVLKIKKIKPYLRANGYLSITCYGVEYRIHQLVAIHFMNHIPNKHHLVIDHIDGNTLNNHISNLQLIGNFQNLVKGRYYKSNESKLLQYLEGVDMIDFNTK
jgi:hypothetical protein